MIEECNYFYNSFIEILNDDFDELDEKLDEKSDEKSDNNLDEKLSDSRFRVYLIKERGKTVELVKLITPSLINHIKKPQQLLHDDLEYYIAIDIYTNTYYVCYKRLMMIDIDFYKSDIQQNIDEIITIFTDYAKQHKLRFRLYKSRNGVHGFLISEFGDYKSDKYIQMMLDLQCDFYYIIYSYIRGWSVRLNKKAVEEEMSYNFICDVGDSPTISLLENLTNLHINLLDVFKNVAPSKMFGN